MPSEREVTQRDLAAELPGWNVEVGARGGWWARSPTYRHDGILVEADDPAELIARVRCQVAIVEMAAGRVGVAPEWWRDRAAMDTPTGPQGAALRARVADPAAYPAREAVALQEPQEAQGSVPLNDLGVARTLGYEGEFCGACGAATMVRNGSCLKCVTCGETSGCS